MTLEGFSTEEIVDETTEKTPEEITFDNMATYLNNENLYDKHAISKYEEYKDEFPDEYNAAVKSKEVFHRNFKSSDISTMFSNKNTLLWEYAWEIKRAQRNSNQNKINIKKSTSKREEMTEKSENLKKDIDIILDADNHALEDMRRGANYNIDNYKNISLIYGIDNPKNHREVLNKINEMRNEKERIDAIIEDEGQKLITNNTLQNENNAKILEYKDKILKVKTKYETNLWIINDYIENYKYLKGNISALENKEENINKYGLDLNTHLPKYYNKYLSNYANKYTQDKRNTDNNTDIPIKLFEIQEKELLDTYQNILRDYLWKYPSEKGIKRKNNEISLINIKEELLIYNSHKNAELQNSNINIDMFSIAVNNWEESNRYLLSLLYDITNSIWFNEKAEKINDDKTEEVIEDSEEEEKNNNNALDNTPNHIIQDNESNKEIVLPNNEDIQQEDKNLPSPENTTNKNEEDIRGISTISPDVNNNIKKNKPRE